MRKLGISFTELSCFFILTCYFSTILSIPNICNFHPQRVQSIHKNLKKLINNELIYMPAKLPDKQQLRKIWYEGGHRDKIQRIISKEDILTEKDLLDLKSLILEEKKLLPKKIKNIADTANQSLFNKISEALKFKKAEYEIEEIFKEFEISADALLKKENQIHDTILNKINQINNFNAYK